MSEYKTCTKCKQSKPLSSFSIHRGKKAAKSGLRAACKNCEAIAYKQYKLRNSEKVAATKKAYNRRNPKKVKAWGRTYQAKNREKLSVYLKNYRAQNLERIKELDKQWRLRNSEYKKIKDAEWAKNNLDKVREASRRYRQNNPEKAKESSRKYQKRNPEIARAIAHRRRARIAELQVYKLPPKSIRRLMNRDCAYCGKKSKHLDHVIPISRGGYTGLGNLIQSCASCNLSKNSLLVVEWKLRRKKNGY
jgi:hypothetical protein